MKTNRAEAKGKIEKLNGVLYYMEEGEPVHAGVIRLNGNIYYAGSGGELICGHHKTVHRDMAHGILKRGVYEFDEDGVLVPGSYRKPKKKKRNGLLRALKLTKKKRLYLIGAAAALLLFVIGIAADLLRAPVSQKPVQTDPAATAESAQGASLIELPPDGELVWLCSPAMQAVYEGKAGLESAISPGDSPYRPYVFRYQLQDGARAELTLAGQEYQLSPYQTELEIDNLETDRTYRYSVAATEGDRSETYTGSFRTADSNRFISFTGIRNVRDIGGYETVDGKQVREGVLIRGQELDGLVERSYFMENPEEAEPFEFRFDMDLRQELLFDGNYVSRLGENVRHKFYTAPSYGSIFAVFNYPTIKQIFSDLADAKNYPMYLHCTYGADRTGTIVFLLQGVLGVFAEDMDFEYCLTGFVRNDCMNPENLAPIYNGLASYPGETVNEQIEYYLTEIVGVPQADLDSIRSIFLE